MRKFKPVSLSGLLIAFMSAAAMAASDCPDFETADADTSGEVSYTEISTFLPDLSESVFADFDSDESGGLNANEYENMKAEKCDAESPF